MKFKDKKDGTRVLKFKDRYGDTLKVENVFVSDCSHLYFTTGGEVVSVPRNEARKLAEVILAELG
jgi:hypothetical protein